MTVYEGLDFGGLGTWWVVNDYTYTDAAGYYQVAGLMPEPTYKVEFFDPAGNYVTQ